jgi:hypothetical protein
LPTLAWQLGRQACFTAELEERIDPGRSVFLPVEEKVKATIER